MSVRLVLASLWLPPWVVRRELARVAHATTAVLDRLLRQYAPDALRVIQRTEPPLLGSAARRRAALAAGHRARVKGLTDVLGREPGLVQMRRLLFESGVLLGEEAVQRLGLRRTRRDFVRAARILYRVLGIRLRVPRGQRDEMRVEMTRCALATEYSPDVCIALSATDAGVVAGLWPGARLEFDARITEGKSSCRARLTLPERESRGGR